MAEKPQCPLCGGPIEQGTTTFTADFGKGVVVVRNVPAEVCMQCGESWIADETGAQLENTVQSARENDRQFSVIDMAA